MGKNANLLLGDCGVKKGMNERKIHVESRS
jgi:hypothetical protein